MTLARDCVASHGNGPQTMGDFVDGPGLWGDRLRAAEHVAPGLAPAVAHRLFGERTGARAARLLASRLGAGDPAGLDAVDAGLCLAAPAALDAMAERAGAIWHAASIGRLILAADIARLAARHPQARTLALRHAALAPPGVPACDPDGLGDAIARDGARCLSAWIDTLPAWAAKRVRLKWLVPPWSGSPARAGEGMVAAGIVRALAATEPA